MRIVLYFVLATLFFACNEINKPKTIAVAIQPLENIPPEKTTLAVEAIKQVYGFEVHALEKKTIPKTFVTLRKGMRYRADKIIKWLHKNNEQQTDYTIGITEVEICTDKKNEFGMQKQPESKYIDWAVFGLGYIGRSGCVVSTRRLGPGNLGNNRFQKVVVHEIGHNLGLPHCPNHCVMADAAESIKTVDKVPMKLCSACLSKIN